MCETKYKEYEVKEKVPDCRVMKVPWCEKDHNGQDTDVCYDVPKRICELKEETLKKVLYIFFLH